MATCALHTKHVHVHVHYCYNALAVKIYEYFELQSHKLLICMYAREVGIIHESVTGSIDSYMLLFTAHMVFLIRIIDFPTRTIPAKTSGRNNKTN